MDPAETQLVLQGIRVPITSFFSKAEEEQRSPHELPEILRRLVPLLERACDSYDLDREFSNDTMMLLWKLLNERSEALRGTSGLEHTISTATMQWDLLQVLVECVHRGLKPHRNLQRSFPRAVVEAVLHLPFHRRLPFRAQRLLLGKVVKGRCGDYATLFQLLFLVSKRSRHLDDLAAIVVMGRGHAWNWLVSTHEGWIAPIDVHSAAVAATPAGSVWNTELDGMDMPNVSAFASTLMVYFDLHPLLIGRDEVVDFFDLLFTSAGDQRRELAYRIAQHGCVHPAVEDQLIRLWPLPGDQKERRAQLGGPDIPMREFRSPKGQLRLFARAFDE